MQYFRDGDTYKIVRVTGPHHNMLTLVLSPKTDHPAEIVEALPCPAGESELLTAEEVRHQVCEGVAEANAHRGSSFHVERIQFVPSDTPPATVYKLMAASLIHRLADGKQFHQLAR